MIRSQPRWFEVSVRGAIPEAWTGAVISSAGGKTLVKLPDVDDLSLFLAKVQESRSQVVSVWPRRETLEDLFLREVRK